MLQQGKKGQDSFLTENQTIRDRKKAKQNNTKDKFIMNDCWQ